MNRRAIFAAVLAFICAGCSGNPPPPPPPPSSDVAAKPLAPSRPTAIPSVERPNTASPKPQAPTAVISDEKPSQAAKSSGTPNPSPSRSESLPLRATGTSVAGPDAAGHFIASISVDGEGNTWIGTEDRGVLRSHKNGKWTQFTIQDGLGDDNVYSITSDRLGRIWVGHLHSGVSVFNGESWKNFGVLEEPLGERVYDIACNPVDGDIWIATNAGLSRYSEPSQDVKSAGMGAGKWSYVTRADGLPSDQVNAIAFSPNGDLFAGTQCSGLAISRRESGYSKWQVVSGEQSDAKTRQPQWTGIPSPLINDVLVSHDGVVYVASVLGLAKSKNQGVTWEYVRGRDFVDKVKGRFEPPPKNWGAPPAEKLALLLPEDFVTCLAEDERGRLWVGFRQKGFLVIDPKSGTTFHGTDDVLGVKEPYVNVIQPRSDGLAWIGGYGSGISVLKTPVPVPPALEVKNSPKTPTNPVANPVLSRRFPQPATEPLIQEMRDLQQSLEGKGEPLKTPAAVFLGDDWITQGNWVGRLGRQYTILCAMNAPLNDALISDFRYRVRGGVGPNGGAFGPQKEKRELLRHWVHRRRWDDPRVLYNPVIGYRRQADWDDHGETYPMTHEGPDVWVSIEVPEGLHRLSFYFFNKDGHSGPNRFRDYLIEVKEGATDPLHAERLPTLARSRVQQFWGGVYKQFAVTGPGKYAVKIGRNGSFNTILQGVMIDQLSGPPGVRQDIPLPCLGNLRYDPPTPPKIEPTADERWRSAVNLWNTLEAVKTTEHGLVRQRNGWLLALRAARNASAPEELQANWRWRLRIWTEKERRSFDETMAVAWKKHLELNPQLLNVKDPDRSQ